MKKISLSLVGLLALAWTALAGDQDFRLDNYTGFPIWSVYVSPTGENSWEEDVLQNDTLASGGSVTIHFSPREQTTYWDLMVKSKSGGTYCFYRVNLLTVSSIVLTYDSDRDEVTAHYR